MDGRFKKGDVVQLKSGGPAMTVYDVNKPADPDRLVHCKWYSHETHSFEVASFEPETLNQFEA